MEASNRIERERAYHDQRFATETRLREGKFYRGARSAFRLYQDSVSRLAKDTDVLEYGCGRGERSLELAHLATSVHGIDISEVGVSVANDEARRRGLRNLRFSAMNAEALTFDDDSFDLVFGSGILHHLDLDASLREVARVLRPEGTAVFIEPLGVNPVLNWYRSQTPAARTPDEHPLLPRDFETMRSHFSVVETDFRTLLSVGAVAAPRESQAFDLLLGWLERVDKVLLRGPLRWQAWFCVISLQAPERSASELAPGVGHSRPAN